MGNGFCAAFFGMFDFGAESFPGGLDSPGSHGVPRHPGVAADVSPLKLIRRLRSAVLW